MELGLGGIALGDRLIELSHIIDLHLLDFARTASAFAESDAWEEDGYDSAIGWIKDKCHITGGAAADRICAGERLSGLSDSAAAVEDGKIGFAHFALIARTSEAVGPALNERGLLKKAAKLTIVPFRNVCMHARHAADAERYAGEQAACVEARTLRIYAADDGTVTFRGMLDAAGGAALQSALEPLAKRAGKDDDRAYDRRLADALVDLSMHALDSGLVPQTAGQRTHLQVTSTLETLLGACGAPAGELEFSLPISSKTVQRLACDCSITRILIDSDSMVIDVGRAKRVVSGPTRKALNVRDGRCVWPGCDRPAHWTSAHHLVHWIHGGGTDLPNLALIWYRHHWMVHEGNWQLARGDDGTLVTVPPVMAFGPPSRAPALG